MIYTLDSHASLYIGDAQDGIIPQDLSGSKQAFALIAQKMSVQGLVFLKQVHGIASKEVVSPDALTLPYDIWREEGDILLTNLTGIGIGVITADCLPIVLYDTKNKAVSVVHAGWRGTVQGAATRAVSLMQESFGTKIEDLRVHFGPSAKACCYEVDEPFIKTIGEQVDCADEVLIKRNSVFFDLPGLNRRQLVAVGIKPDQFTESHNHCTICCSQYCSYRRDAGESLRQATVVMLR